MARAKGVRAGVSGLRSSSQNSESTKWGVFLLGFTPLVLMASRFILPQRLVDNRSGIGILDQVYSWGHALLPGYAKEDFPAHFYHAFYTAFPFMPENLQIWDAVVLGFGIVLTIGLFARFTGLYKQSSVQVALLLVLAIIAGIFVFQVSKDFIQFLLFMLAFAIAVARKLDTKWKIIALVALFSAEGLLWRSYYLITAVFLPILYAVISRLLSRARSSKETVKYAVGIAVLMFIAMVVFAWALHAVSPGNYNQIVYQHSVEREGFTATDAASGISSVIPLSTGSSVLAFVVNWAINFFRLLLPVELLAKSIWYLPFIVYQLAITYCLIRAIPRFGDDKYPVILVAVMLAFMVTSAAFEPDFGSWLRHETTTLPFLIELIGLSSVGVKEINA